MTATLADDILQLAGPFARQWIADFAGMTTAGHVDGNDLAVAETAMARRGRAAAAWC